ncbi:hypothetical protein FHS43_000944 [Streptosporangium becharense]|uniref:substrate-binding and VWA domain-containing protein n=1 Tax=Streptosporangium becharense TaxID=1816182 RepID=UPI0018328F1A|nr:substrate-binding and VWA domain-containing protein [Streptosporangium becharense]MBB2909698.1 hypothetical protein [Streptosporangium becharense]
MQTRRRRIRLNLSLTAIAVATVIAGGAVLVFGQAQGSCSDRDPVLVGVAAAVDIAPTAMEAAERFNRSGTAVDGRCVLVQVTEQPPATVLRTLIGDAAGMPGGRPDGWISDSSAWIRLARKREAADLAGTETVVASSPLVFATRRSLARRFAVGGTGMDWRMVFPPTTRGRITPTEDEPDVVRVPDPSLAGAGIATVAAARDVVGTGAEADRELTAFVRWAQAGAAPDYRSMLTAVDDRSFWKRPVVIVPEQAVWEHNRRPSDDPVVALHPREGTVNLDYPYVVTAADGARASGSRAFEAWLRSPETQEAARRAGFRSADGALEPYSPGPEIPTAPPSTRPSILPARIDEALEAWSRLAPPTNVLVLADAGKHMAEPIAGDRGRTRFTVALEAARLGLRLFPDSTHMGMWEFSSVKGDDQRERVRIGPIVEPDGGQVTRRGLLTELTRTLRADPGAPSALYDSVLAGFREVTDAYDGRMNNTLLVITAGKDDGKGVSGAELVRRLREEWDAERPVQIVVLAFGADLDRGTLAQVASVTNGSLHVAREPGEIIDVFLSALARRLCHPTCREPA